MTDNNLINAEGSNSSARWGSEVGAERIDGVPFRMYKDRPRGIDEVLPLGERWGSRPYVIQGDRVLTFAAMPSVVASKCAYLVEQGVAPYNHVLLLGFNSLDWVVNFWASVSIGAVPVLANAWWGGAEVHEAIEALNPTIILADERSSAKLLSSSFKGDWYADLEGRADADQVDALRSGSENDPASIIFTSGTSGRPKAAVLSHRALLANLQMLLNLTHRLPHQVNDASGEVVLHTGPLFHVGGGQMLLRSMVVGNTIVMPDGKFDPGEALGLIERHKIKRWAAVPTMVSRLLDHPLLGTHDLSSLRAVTIGGAPVHGELQRQIALLLPSVSSGVPTGWGLTENGGQATAASGHDSIAYPGSAGRPLPLAELRFVEREGFPDSEVLVRSPTQMSGYVGTVESPIDIDGWLHTGDLGHLDGDGRLWITGRSKDLIIRGGENIAPASVENALLDIRGVVEVAVVGVPHPDLGEEVCAFVVTVDPQMTAEGLSDQLVGRLASFAMPTVWRLQNQALPVNQTGKIDKQELSRIAREA